MKQILLVCCTLLSPSLSAQLTGRLVTTGGEPVPAANVLLYRAADSSLVKAAVSAANGHFMLPAPSGRYLLQCSSTGFSTWQSAVLVLLDTLDVGLIILQTHSRQLSEVEISAAKPMFTQQPGGLTVQVQNSVLTRGSSALEVLGRMPGVLVDRRSNDLLLNNRSVMVMINGRLQRMPVSQLLTYLNGLRADDLEKIELLDTPPASYDAQGGGGLINLVLKKNRRPGLSGNLAVTAGYGKGEKAAVTGGLSYQTKKVDYYGNYSYNRNRSYNRFDVTGFHDIPIMRPHTYFEFESTARPLTEDHLLSLGADVRPAAGWALGASLQLSENRAGIVTSSRGDYLLPPDSALTVTTAARSFNRWRNAALSGYIERKWKEQALQVDVDYLRYGQHNPTSMYNAYLDRYGALVKMASDSLQAPQHRGMGATNIQIGVLAARYTRSWQQKYSLEAGVKVTYNQSNSRSSFRSLIDGVWTSRAVSSAYDMWEGIGAAYASFTAVLSPGTNVVLGGRYEYARGRVRSVKGAEKPVERRQGNFFPNLSIVHRNWSLTYAQRITRPSYNDLSSFVAYNDPVSVFTGNPRLKPGTSYQLKAAYNIHGYSFSASLHKERHPLVYSQTAYGADETLVHFSPQNMDYQQSATMQATLPFKPWSWWSMSYSIWGGIKQMRIRFTPAPVTKTYWPGNFNFSETFRPFPGSSVELSGWVSSRHYYGTIEVRPQVMINGGWRQELGENKGSLQLSVTDIFRLNRNNSLFGRITPEAYGLDSDVMIYPEHTVSILVKLTYSRSFGGGETKLRQGAGEERERVRRE
ncbi:outer membrane beta-barrel protein [Chitinophaga horti]|uniref:Outer membrane beta-barrel protein n=1 Tax=Chitinophaga horti TaxID=2920382 RepID=A0ABY6IUE9_9BACT|nr:TonB-dependent receptor [Chitinophaga horti]UYQ90996.1 outer membrane beta-barrel protein [Chitinophaga horti]